MNLFLNCVNGLEIERPPVWFMRQAGRYLSEYRDTRAKAGSFLDLCYNSEFATEVTLQPIEKFGFDAAILFADILLILDALGVNVQFVEGQGPLLEPVKEKRDIERTASDQDPFSGLAFKIMNDPFVGSLTFMRIYSGSIKKGDSIFNSTKGKKERVGRMMRMHSNNREEINEAFAGDIVALAGMKDTTTGDTLCDLEKPVILETMTFPNPVIEIAVEPKSKNDQEKMSAGLQRLAAEDPSFQVSTDIESGQTIMKGMGELHLDILIDRLKREFKVEANIGAPQVAYRETITKEVEVDYTHKKQSGGAGQFARVKLIFYPNQV